MRSFCFARRIEYPAPVTLLAFALAAPTCALAQYAGPPVQPQTTTPAAQQPTPAAPATVPSEPTPQPVPASSLPSEGTPPQQPSPAVTAPQTNAQQPAQPYKNPLDQPITVAPGPPAALPTPTQVSAKSIPSLPAYDPRAEHAHGDPLGSAYIAVDSPIYPMALRLYSLGYLDTAFISMRPWTRRSLLHMLDVSHLEVTSSGNDEAIDLLARIESYLQDENPANTMDRGYVAGIDTAYTRFMGISGPVLRDSYHLGQTIVNDYGRPYATGFNNITGFSGRAEWWRFSLYMRGEYQHAPAYAGYSYALANQLSCTDLITPCPMPVNYTQATIPYNNTGAQDNFRLQEASLSFHVLGHEISGGKTDAWLGPAQGGAMGWSNNAENIYSFRINRVEPMHIPLVDKVLGPLRYDFFVGSLKGHTYPNSPWVHSSMFSFRPYHTFEFSFQRTVIWGGKGHEPVTLHTFFKSFFDINDTTAAEKYSRNDPGARYSVFNFSWRLPYLEKYVTLYTDMISHDDVTPISAPRRAAYRPGLFISQFPHLPKLDFRAEAASTDTSTLRSFDGQFNYYEIVQRQGYTNKGFIMGDWIGREAKGGQAWLTYHLSPDEFIQLEYLNKKTPKDFIPGGTTQNQFKIDVVKNLTRSVQLDAWYQFERWKAPVPLANISNPLIITGAPLYYTGAQNDSTIAAQFTWYPKLHRASSLLSGK